MSSCSECGHTKKAERKPRAPSAYNTYFKEKMALAEIKALPHRERMTKIGVMWKQDKDTYTQSKETETTPPPQAQESGQKAKADESGLPAGKPVLVRSL